MWRSVDHKVYLLYSSLRYNFLVTYISWPVILISRLEKLIRIIGNFDGKQDKLLPRFLCSAKVAESTSVCFGINGQSLAIGFGGHSRVVKFYTYIILGKPFSAIVPDLAKAYIPLQPKTARVGLDPQRADFAFLILTF